MYDRLFEMCGKEMEFYSSVLNIITVRTTCSLQSHYETLRATSLLIHIPGRTLVRRLKRAKLVRN